MNTHLEAGEGGFDLIQRLRTNCERGGGRGSPPDLRLGCGCGAPSKANYPQMTQIFYFICEICVICG